MNSLVDITFLFLKLGCTAFGGPVAHIALMEQDIVSRRRWMTREHFLDLLGLTNLIPGPNSTEMAMQCGLHRGGFPGLIAAGLCFTAPAVILTTFLAYLYQSFGQVPSFAEVFLGLRPVVVALMLTAVFKLGRSSVKNMTLAGIGACVMMYAISGGSEIAGILVGGLLGMSILMRSRFTHPSAGLMMAVPAAAMAAAPVVPSLSGMSFSFFKIGATFFGGGYTIFAYFQDEFVHRLGWISTQQLMDAVAVGQITPGPVLSSAAFIGYLLFGVQGAILASVAIFLPAFILVAVLQPFLAHLRKSPWMSAFLDAVNVSAVAVMAAVILLMGAQTLSDAKTILIFAVSLGLMIRFPGVSSVWWMLAAGFFGWVSG